MKVGANPATANGKKGEKLKNPKPQLALDSAFKKTRSGLERYMERPGRGAKAKKGDTIQVHYEGWLAKDYKMFDSSRKKHKTFELTLGEGSVIDGWEEGMLGVRKGSKLQLKIPAKLAYGRSGAPAAGVPKNADLIFKVEVMKIIPPKEVKPKRGHRIA